MVRRTDGIRGVPDSEPYPCVDASNPFVPMGTKVVMNGVEYTVEDTGAFARYGVQFDVYYDSHSAASAHGHQTWELFLAMIMEAGRWK